MAMGVGVAGLWQWVIKIVKIEKKKKQILTILLTTLSKGAEFPALGDTLLFLSLCLSLQ